MMTTPETIDRAALRALLETVGDDPEFLGELIGTYFTDAPSLLESMRAAATAGDGETLRRAAHSLKSNSATFGASELATLCQELEGLGRAGRVTEAAGLLVRAETEYERVRRALPAARDDL